MVRKAHDNIYSFPITLPNNPLKYLNCYVVRGAGNERSLLIDSGFHMEQCTRELLEGMNELGLSPENTDILFTHLHADHTGNGKVLESMGYRIFMGELDYNILFYEIKRSPWELRSARMGIPQDAMEQIVSLNPAKNYAPTQFKAEPICDGDVLLYGGRELECILVPGHTPGNFCLFDRADELMLTGDHILFDITPNITSWQSREDSLGDYLDSLKKTAQLKIKTALPAHRNTSDKSVYDRIDELLAHHRFRLEESLRAVVNDPGISAFDAAQRVSWNIRAKNWDDFPPGQKWFAVGECLAHLQHLAVTGRVIEQIDVMGILRYYPR